MMLTHTRWSHPPGSTVVPSQWQATDALRTYVRNPTAAMCSLALLLALLPHDLYVVLVPAALLPVLLWLPARGAGSRSRQRWSGSTAPGRGSGRRPRTPTPAP